MHHIAIQGRRPIFGEQRDLPGAAAALVERFDRLAPSYLLRIVDLAEIPHVALHRAAATDAAVFNDAPIPVLLAVLVARLVAQEHAGRVPNRPVVAQESRSALQPVWANCFGKPA
jgi:hypothetical protein